MWRLADARNYLIGTAYSQLFFRSDSSLRDFDFFLGAFTVHPMFAVPSFTDNLGHRIHLARICSVCNLISFLKACGT